MYATYLKLYFAENPVKIGLTVSKAMLLMLKTMNYIVNLTLIFAISNI